jgi:ankyrin repeat protein
MAGDNRTPLLAAADVGDVAIGAILIDHGAKVQEVTLLGTPLMVAAGNGHLSFVRMLIDRGVDLDYTDGDGFSARRLAIDAKHQDIVTLINAALGRLHHANGVNKAAR